jgi:hypothetical protein
VVYVESPQPMPQIVQKVVERLAPAAAPMMMQVMDDRLISEQRLPNNFQMGQVPSSAHPFAREERCECTLPRRRSRVPRLPVKVLALSVERGIDVVVFRPVPAADSDVMTDALACYWGRADGRNAGAAGVRVDDQPTDWLLHDQRPQLPARPIPVRLRPAVRHPLTPTKP